MSVVRRDSQRNDENSGGNDGRSHLQLLKMPEAEVTSFPTKSAKQLCKKCGHLRAIDNTRNFAMNWRCLAASLPNILAVLKTESILFDRSLRKLSFPPVPVPYCKIFVQCFRCWNWIISALVSSSQSKSPEANRIDRITISHLTAWYWMLTT